MSEDLTHETFSPIGSELTQYDVRQKQKTGAGLFDLQQALWPWKQKGYHSLIKSHSRG